jgi:hypothetical protein
LSLYEFLLRAFFSWAGFRSFIAEHTVAEHNALKKYSREYFQVVEIGVAEGASAIALRDGMNPRGNLYLIETPVICLVHGISIS